MPGMSGLELLNKIKSDLREMLWVNVLFSTSVRHSMGLENDNPALADTVGLEKIGGLREPENLREPFILPERS